MKGDSESQSKDQLFRLEQWSNIIRLQPEIKHDFINLVRQVCWLFSWRIALIAGGIWNGDIQITDIEELENLEASDVDPCRLNAKEVQITQREGEFAIAVADGWYSKIEGKRLRIPGTHSEKGTNLKERGSHRRSSRRSGRVSTGRNKR